MISFSRKDRKERRDLFTFLFHACAGVVASVEVMLKNFALFAASA